MLFKTITRSTILGFEYIIIKFEIYKLFRTIFGYLGLFLVLNIIYAWLLYGVIVQSRPFCSSGASF